MITLITHIANAVGISPLLLLSVCWQETNHKTLINAQDGHSASYGVCQIKLNTARMIIPSVKPSDLLISEVNIFIAAKYLQKQLARYNHNEYHAIAAYNAGRVKLNKNGLPINQEYVKSVMRHKLHKPWRLASNGH